MAKFDIDTLLALDEEIGEGSTDWDENDITEVLED
jgi:hypothetical protein